MTAVPEAYYQFVMDYAPYVYVIPPDTPDSEWGKAAFAAACAIDFLYEAHFNEQFEDRTTEINSKIVNLADWILTQQCKNEAKLAYGGFKSNENSTYYYSVDACRVIPSLTKAYELTNNTDYFNSAVLAAATFLYNMQQKPSQLGVHDKYYGGFARAVTDAGAWLQQMDIETLYGLIALKTLCEHDSANKSKYETMTTDATDFYRSGFEKLYLHYDPPPTGDGEWYRTDSKETTIYDDPFAYALLGLYNCEGWSTTVQKVYNFINAIGANSQYPAYNPAVCWAGYINVVSHCPACDYYDAVTAGILWKIRKEREKPSLWFSMKIIDNHQEQFMYWGVKHNDFSFVENKKAMATVCWLSLMYLNYQEPSTRFTQILRSKGENVTLYPVVETGERISYGESVDIQAIVSPTRIGEILIEPGYMIEDYVTAYVFAPLRHHDKLGCKGRDYEVQTVQPFSFKGETAHFKAVCRRLVNL